MSQDPENSGDGAKTKARPNGASYEEIQRASDKLERKNPGQFRPGGPGGPGRPKGIAAAARLKFEQIRGLDIAADIAQGNVKGAAVRDRMQALQFLADRGYGKPLDVSVQARVEAYETVAATLDLDDHVLAEVARSLSLPASSPPVDPTKTLAPANPAASQVVDADVVE